MLLLLVEIGKFRSICCSESGGVGATTAAAFVVGIPNCVAVRLEGVASFIAAVAR